jgi:predicted O-linked N-acetylglucosamine transferase (SPINDLY family)
MGMDYFSLAVHAGNSGDFSRAVGYARQGQILNPKERRYALIIARAEIELGNYESAEIELTQLDALGNERDELNFLFGRLNQCKGLYEEALKYYNQIRGSDVPMLVNRSICHIATKNFMAARRDLVSASAIDKTNVTILRYLSRVYTIVEELEAALKTIQKARYIVPFDIDLIRQHSTVLCKLNRSGEANSLLINLPAQLRSHPEIRLELAKVLIAQERNPEALDLLDTIDRERVSPSELYLTLASCLDSAGDKEKTIAVLERIIDHGVDIRFPVDRYVILNLETLRLDRFESVSNFYRNFSGDFDLNRVNGLALMYLEDDPMRLREVAERYFQSYPSWATIRRRKKYQIDKSGVAYISPDFRKHPVGYLMLDVIRAQIDMGVRVTLLHTADFTDSVTDAYRELCGENFVDVSDHSDRALADLINTSNFDVLVELAGLTAGFRHGLYRQKIETPVVNYLGYPGTLGCPAIKNLVATELIVPRGSEDFYSENVIKMKGNYFPVLSSRIPKGTGKVRSDYGLPSDKYLISILNNRIKFNPATVKLWCDIGAKCPEAIFWAPRVDDAANARLFDFMGSFGIARERIFIAESVDSNEEHLARLRLANAFLDTYPYGAHTTAADHLLAGVRVYTLFGNCFQSRVGFDTLTALGMEGCCFNDRTSLLNAFVRDYQNYVTNGALVGDHPALMELEGCKPNNYASRLTEAFLSCETL